MYGNKKSTRFLNMVQLQKFLLSPLKNSDGFCALQTIAAERHQRDLHLLHSWHPARSASPGFLLMLKSFVTRQSQN